MSEIDQHSPTENKTFDMMHMMDSLIGPNKQKYHEGERSFGLPQPLKSKEELMIERGMESCTFKTTISCVLG